MGSLKDLIVKELKIVKDEMQAIRQDIKSLDTTMMLDKKIEVVEKTW